MLFASWNAWDPPLLHCSVNICIHQEAPCQTASKDLEKYFTFDTKQGHGVDLHDATLACLHPVTELVCAAMMMLHSLWLSSCHHTICGCHPAFPKSHWHGQNWQVSQTPCGATWTRLQWRTWSRVLSCKHDVRVAPHSGRVGRKAMRIWLLTNEFNVTSLICSFLRIPTDNYWHEFHN